MIRRLTLCALVWACAAQASAHDPPKGFKLVWASDDADELPVVVSNRGLVFADRVDGGMRLSLRCCEGYGATVSDNPSVFVGDGGLITLGIYRGVYQSTDRLCTMQQTNTGLPDASIASVVSAPDSTDNLFLTVPTLKGTQGVFASTDRGNTWSESFHIDDNEFYSGLIPAPSAPERLYAYGLRTDQMTVASVTYLCSVSQDSGKTWEDHALTGKVMPVVPDAGVSEKVTPLAVDPNNPDVMFGYAPIDKLETQFRILRSMDRCASFDTVLDGVVQPNAFAFAPDSSKLWLGLGIAGMGGLYLSTDSGAHFDQVFKGSVQTVSCLQYRGDRLWMCANMAPNTNGIWYSDDQGATFQTFFTFEQVTEPVACDGDAGAVCDQPWRDFDTELHLWSDAGSASDAGVVDAGGATDARVKDAANETSKGTGSSADDEPETHNSSSGCQAGAGSAAPDAWAAWAIASLLLTRRRRRRA